MCSSTCMAVHLLCYKFHHWFWPFQIDSAVTVSNEPYRQSQGKKKTQANKFVPVGIQIVEFI